MSLKRRVRAARPKHMRNVKCLYSFVCNLASLLDGKGCVGRDERNAESWAIKSNIGFQKSARCMFFSTYTHIKNIFKEHFPIIKETDNMESTVKLRRRKEPKGLHEFEYFFLSLYCGEPHIFAVSSPPCLPTKPVLTL